MQKQVYLVSLPGNEQGAGGSAKSSVGAIIEVFVKHTSVALYLLSGAYMIELLKEEAATAHVVSGSPSELFVNLREKSRAHSSMVRRYAHEALRGPKYQDLPSIFDIDSVGKDELGSDGSLIASVPKQIRKLLEKVLGRARSISTSRMHQPSHSLARLSAACRACWIPDSTQSSCCVN